MKTALILGGVAVGVYFLLKHLQGASTPLGSLAPSAPPAASGIAPGRTAASTLPGSQMRSYSAANTKPGNMVTLGGLLAVQQFRRSSDDLPPTSFTPSSPNVSINQVTPPDATKVSSITNPNPPMLINRSSGLSRNLLG